MPMSVCKRCGGAEVVQKSRGRLVVVGVVMLVAAAAAVIIVDRGGGIGWVVRVLAAIAALTGAYLLAWASVGRGRWCRTCKRFDGV
jgi:hypothetical protein